MCDEVDEIDKVQLLTSEIESLQLKVDSLSNTVFELKTRVQSSVDLTDDLISSANNSINVVESRVASTLQHTDTVLDSAHELIDFYLIVFTLLAGVIGIAITYYLGKKQNDHLDRAAEKLAININEDENFKNELVMKLLKNESFRNDIFISMKKYNSGTDDFSEQIADMKEQFDEDK